MTETVPGSRAAAEGGTPAAAEDAGLRVFAPLRVEARAIRRGLRQPASRVVRAGMRGSRLRRPELTRRPGEAGQPDDQSRSASQGSTAGAGQAGRDGGRRLDPFGPMVVMGTAAGLDADLRPGDLVVATEVTDGDAVVRLPGADLLAGELRRAGLRARAGRVRTVDKLVRPAQRSELSAQGYLAADMESARLLLAAGDGPKAVIRAVSDKGAGPAIVAGG
ncbi:MAG: hypothetical protein J2P25_25265, partial [Nocardiopsaceae bacterium]|nr:hypothetical protein [Nocardiopsaceae bacterium]